ncbi:MAG: SnoaL-like domain-containing protein [Ginsengibacter sp.]
MTTKEIANSLAELCRKGDFETARKELFSEDAVSIEPYASPAFKKETKGLKAILEKGKKFGEMVEEMYGNTVSEPVIAGNAIALKGSMDVKMKGRERESMSELCIYTVKNGKIISEQFFM